MKSDQISQKTNKNSYKGKEHLKLHTLDSYNFLSLIYSKDILGFSFRIRINSKPKFRILNGLEQCAEAYNEDLYLVIKCKNYKTVGFRMVGVEKIYEELTQEMYNKEDETYTINLFYKAKIV